MVFHTLMLSLTQASSRFHYMHGYTYLCFSLILQINIINLLNAFQKEAEKTSKFQFPQFIYGKWRLQVCVFT